MAMRKDKTGAGTKPWGRVRPEEKFTPSYPGEQQDDVDPQEIARREAEKAQLVGQLSPGVKREAPAVVPVVDPAVVAQAAAAVEDANREATVVSEEMAALQAELAQLQAEQRQETERLEREYAQKLADVQRRQSLAQAKSSEAQQQAGVVALGDRARRRAEEQRKDDALAQASKADKDTALRARLGPKIEVARAELRAIREIDTSGLQVLAQAQPPRRFPPHLQSKWNAEVWSVARELLLRINLAASSVRDRIEEAEGFVKEGWQEHTSFELWVNTHARDLDRASGLAAVYRQDMATLEQTIQKLEGYAKTHKASPTDEAAAPDRKRGEISEARAYELGKGRKALQDRIVDMDPLPVRPGGGDTHALGIEGGRPKV